MLIASQSWHKLKTYLCWGVVANHFNDLIFHIYVLQEPPHALAHGHSSMVLKEAVPSAQAAAKSSISLKRLSNGQLVICAAEAATPAEQPLQKVSKIHLYALFHLNLH
jgi:hypothetical protein